MPGSFIFKPIQASLKHNTEALTKMDPYCTFKIGDEMVKSQTCKKGGKFPHWNDVVTIPAPSIDDSTQLTVKIMDKDLMFDDDIGTVSINLKDLQSQGKINKWFTLSHKKKHAGELLLEASYEEEQQIPKSKSYVEQRQSVKPNYISEEVDDVDIVPALQNIEVLEPTMVTKTIQYTKLVPVMKQIETIESHVVTRTIDILEPQVVPVTILVVRNVLVQKQVDVIESETVIKEVEVLEPQTFTKEVQVTELVRVPKQVEVTGPVHVKIPVELAQKITTIETITKKPQETLIVSDEFETTVGPATVIYSKAFGIDKRGQELLQQEGNLCKI